MLTVTIPDFDPDKKYPLGTKKAAKLEAERFYRDLMMQTFREARRVSAMTVS